MRLSRGGGRYITLTRGRVRAGPSLQLSTLSTRIALYTRRWRWRASPGVLTHADYTLGAVAPLLRRHTFSGLAALCRMPKTKLIGRPVPEIWANLARTHTTYQQPTNQPAVLPVPSCKLGIDSVTLTFNLLTSNKTDDQDLSCTIHLLSLVMICPVVFVFEC